jgi:hypothetical protein
LLRLAENLLPLQPEVVAVQLSTAMVRSCSPAALAEVVALPAMMEAAEAAGRRLQMPMAAMGAAQPVQELVLREMEPETGAVDVTMMVTRLPNPDLLRAVAAAAGPMTPVIPNPVRMAE